MKKIAIIALLLGTFHLGLAQRYPDNEPFKIGLNAGLNFTSVWGGELVNPSVKYGFVVGMYYRQPLKKLKNQHLQAELRAAFRGSRFNNEGEDRYNRINLFYLDAPIVDYIELNKEGNKFLVVGGQYSQLINSLVFINPIGTRPISSGIDVKNYDISAVLGYHVNGYYMGWSFVATMGLIDINDGLNLPDVLPTTGNGKSIRNISISALVYF